MHLQDWQVNWAKWYSVIPWFHRGIYDFPEQDLAWYEYYCGFGSFLQFRFWGKSWPTRLVRSPEYSIRMKELLLKDLESVKFSEVRN